MHAWKGASATVSAWSSPASPVSPARRAAEWSNGPAMRRSSNRRASLASRCGPAPGWPASTRKGRMALASPPREEAGAIAQRKLLTVGSSMQRSNHVDLSHGRRKCSLGRRPGGSIDTLGARRCDANGLVLFHPRSLSAGVGEMSESRGGFHINSEQTAGKCWCKVYREQR